MTKVLDDFKLWGYEDIKLVPWHQNLLTRTELFYKRLTALRERFTKQLGAIWD